MPENRRRRHRTWVGVLASFVAIAVLAFALRGRGEDAIEPRGGEDDSPATAAATAQPTGAMPQAPAAAPPPMAPLPAVGTPFRLAIADLQQRARAGDPVAMCRLAAEHAGCKDVRRRLASATGQFDAHRAMAEGEADAKRRQARLARLVERSEALLEESRHCDGVPEVDDPELVRQWRAAALAGSLPALEHYALGQVFPRHRLLSLLPELATYRAEAGALARRAAEAGSLRAVTMLALAHDPHAQELGMGTFLTQAVPADAVESMALLRLALAQVRGGGENPDAARFLEERLAQAEASATPEERGRVDQRLMALQARMGASFAAGLTESAARGDLVAACMGAVEARPPAD